MESKVFEVGKTYVNLNENAGQTVVKTHPWDRRIKKEFYIAKEITVVSSSGSGFFHTVVDDKGNEKTVDNDDRQYFCEKKVS